MVKTDMNRLSNCIPFGSGDKGNIIEVGGGGGWREFCQRGVLTYSPSVAVFCHYIQNSIQEK